MHCSEAWNLLSAYHDGELAPDRSLALEAHLANCDSCRRELASFQRLSEIAVQLRTEERPKSTWRDIEGQLAGRARREGSVGTEPPRRSIRRTATMIAASAVALTLLLAWLVWPRHDHLAADFDEFLQLLDEDVSAAQTMLVSNYDGHPTTVADAAEALKYTPVVARGTPAGFTLDAAYLLKMPCCTCMAAVFIRQDGSCLCVFEHDQEQQIWFGRRPAISVQCHGRPIRLVEVDGTVAASYADGKRHVTIIGAVSVEEVSELVATFTTPVAG